MNVVEYITETLEANGIAYTRKELRKYVHDFRRDMKEVGRFFAREMFLQTVFAESEAEAEAEAS